MDATKVKLEESWKQELLPEFDKEYMHSLRSFLADELQKGKQIFPTTSEWFAAFEATPLNKVKVVILGQDPYHGPNQAHGLCFSVQKGVRPPPSLLNIFKELETDLQVRVPSHGYLMSWAQQGVLLLNTVLTVERGRAASHQGKGWEEFTDQVIQVLNNREEPIIFVLWGSPAQRKGRMINAQKHFVLRSPHPSPLSAHRGFLGSRHFSKINAKLREWGQEEINWGLAP